METKTIYTYVFEPNFRIREKLIFEKKRNIIIVSVVYIIKYAFLRTLNYIVTYIRSGIFPPPLSRTADCYCSVIVVVRFQMCNNILSFGYKKKKRPDQGLYIEAHDFKMLESDGPFLNVTAPRIFFVFDFAAICPYYFS